MRISQEETAPFAAPVHGGSMYSTSISGHSMGGYGTWRIGMKNPELYSSICAMSSCCLAPYTACTRPTIE